MFPSSNTTNNHFFLNTNNDLRFFNDDELLDHIFWQEEVMFTGDEVINKGNNAMADDVVREEETGEKLYQKRKKKKERLGPKDSGVSAPPPRRRTGKKDRHSKIRTAKGFRDRRIRLSVQVSRRFFDLHDMLGFDKASKTLDWLFLKSKEAIKDLSGSFRRSSLERIVDEVNNTSGGGGSKSLSSMSENDVISNEPEDDGSENMPSIGEGASSSVPKRTNRRKLSVQGVDLVKIKDSRTKARARARERTREKKMGKGLGPDTVADIGEPNTNQETGFLGHTTHGLMQIYDEHLMDSPKLFERFLGITSTDMFGPNSNNLYEMIRGTEFLAHDQLGYDSTNTQHHNHNVNFIPLSTSEPNPNLLILPSMSIKEQSQHYP